MEWVDIWRTLFCGWDGDVDFFALARELPEFGDWAPVGDESDAAAWVRRQIQEAY